MKSIGEKYRPAMTITSQEAADKYFKELVDEQVKYSAECGQVITREEIEKIERNNLGYFAGYYNNQIREQVERLFKCAHPVFGGIAEKGPPTPTEAFEMGKKLGEKMRKD